MVERAINGCTTVKGKCHRVTGRRRTAVRCIAIGGESVEPILRQGPVYGLTLAIGRKRCKIMSNADAPCSAHLAQLRSVRFGGLHVGFFTRERKFVPRREILNAIVEIMWIRKRHTARIECAAYETKHHEAQEHSEKKTPRCLFAAHPNSPLLL